MPTTIHGTNGITFNDGSTQNTRPAVGFRNRIINGDMRIWQRGTTISNPISSPNFYTADRWGCNRSGDVTGATVSRDISGLSGFEYSLKLKRTAGNTSTAGLSLWYSNESTNTYDLAGSPVTLSFWAKAGSTLSSAGSQIYVAIVSGTGTDQRIYAYTGGVSLSVTYQTITTSWVRYSFTGTVPANATELGFQITFTPVGTAGADDSLYITGVQLEAGSNASDFERRPIGTELALCQRYYQKKAALAINGLALAGAAVITNAQQDFPDTFPAMRSSPVASISSSSDFQIFVSGVQRAATSLQAVNTSPANCWWYCANNNIGAGGGLTLYATSADAFLAYSSEL